MNWSELNSEGKTTHFLTQLSNENVKSVSENLIKREKCVGEPSEPPTQQPVTLKM